VLFDWIVRCGGGLSGQEAGPACAGAQIMPQGSIM
jgi:hypothetical protein